MNCPKIVFSHRFAPDGKGQIYDIGDSWNTFWNTCFEHSKSFNFAVILDIADFYNQIYHHTLENQLIVEIIQRHSDGDPYRSIWLSELSDQEISKFRPDVAEKIILDYLSATEPDYIRLRWFIRRMAQVGHPAAVNVLLLEFPRLLPAMSEVCRYFISVSQGPDLDWEIIGEDLLKMFNNEIVKSNEYYQLSILSLFAAQQKLDNLAAVVRIYKSASPILRREIIICAARHGAVDWLRELKEEFGTMDPWNRRAFLYSVALLPREEKRFFLKYARSEGVLEELITDWAKK
jgi:hypothetical protein